MVFDFYLKLKRNFWFYFTLLILIWLILLVLLPWRGDFLLNDSYVYEWNVRNFGERGIRLHPYTSPTTILQTILGVFLYFFSQDPSLLRLMTSFFYVIGALFLYKLLVHEGVSYGKSFFLALLLLFNPFYLNLGFSFMSDVYFQSTLIGAFYYYARSFKESSLKYRFLSAFFLSLSFLSRQAAVIVFPAFILTDLYLLFSNRLKAGFSKLTIYLIPIGLFLVYQFLLPVPVMYSEGHLYASIAQFADLEAYAMAGRRLIEFSFYFGFFLFPIGLVFLVRFVFEGGILDRRVLALILFCAAGLVFFALNVWFNEGELMFYIPNVLNYNGFRLGGLPLGEKHTIFLYRAQKVGFFTTGVSILSFVGLVSYTATSLFDRFRLDVFQKYPEYLAMLLSFLAFLFVLGFFGIIYDRYLLFFVPLLIVFVSKGGFIDRKVYSTAFLIMTFGLMVFSGVYEHDHLSMNKRVWEIPNIYEIDPSNYYSTFEYVRYQKLDSLKDSSDVEYMREILNMKSKEGYTHFLSYNTLEGFERLDRPNYFSLISPNFSGSLVLLKKE